MLMSTEGEIKTLNPIQVNCPGCQKVYLVRPEDLTAGEARFQCTACSQIFAFPWPQPPEVQIVKARLLTTEESGVFPLAHSNTSPNISKPVRRCAQCGEKVDAKLSECPKCGVIFDKIKKVRVGEPVLKNSTVELNLAWDKIKENYGDIKSHEEFIQLCLSKDNFAFASRQYRAVLDANPSDEIANKMQNRIIELATFSYITSKENHEVEKPKYAGFTKFMTILSALFIISGLFVSWARPLIAVGVSIIVFVFAAKYFGK